MYARLIVVDAPVPFLAVKWVCLTTALIFYAADEADGYRSYQAVGNRHCEEQLETEDGVARTGEVVDQEAANNRRDNLWEREGNIPYPHVTCIVFVRW